MFPLLKMEQIGNVPFRWLGSEIKCPNKSHLHKNYKYYSGCALGKVHYYIGNAVMVRHKDKIVPGCIHYFYEDLCVTSKTEKYYVCLELFYFAKDIIDEIKNPINFTFENEIIKKEILTYDFVSVENILYQCTIIFGLDSETPEEIIQESDTTPDITYVCRYIACRSGKYFLLKGAVTNQIYISDDDDDVQIISDSSPTRTTVIPRNLKENNSIILLNNPYTNTLEVNIIHGVTGVHIEQKNSENLLTNKESEIMSGKVYCITDDDTDEEEKTNEQKKWKSKIKTPECETKIPVVVLSKLPIEFDSSLNLTNCEESPINSKLENKSITPLRRSSRISSVKSVDKSVTSSSKKPKRKYTRRNVVQNDKTVKPRRGRRPKNETTQSKNITSGASDTQKESSKRTLRARVDKNTKPYGLRKIQRRSYKDILSQTDTENEEFESKSKPVKLHKEEEIKNEVSVEKPKNSVIKSDLSPSKGEDELKTPISIPKTIEKIKNSPRARLFKNITGAVTDSKQKSRVKFEDNNVDLNKSVIFSPETPKRIHSRKRSVSLHQDTDTDTPTKRKDLSCQFDGDDSDSDYSEKAVLFKRRVEDDNNGKIKKPKVKRRQSVKNLEPMIEERNEDIQSCVTPMQKARVGLSAGRLPSQIPCRDHEYSVVYQFVMNRIQQGKAGCMYISGVPGTGKTMTVCRVMEDMKTMENDRDLPKFEFLHLNALALTEPRQIYVEIIKKLTNKTCHWEEALNIMLEYFTKRTKKPHIILIDELDKLCNKKQDVIYILLDLPFQCVTPLSIIAIANTMDLPERVLTNKVNSRLGLVRLTFKPYSYKDLVSIVTERLQSQKVFKSEALELIARKVAAVSGDARRALAMCTRATEIAEEENIELISVDIIDRVLEEMISSSKVQAIKSCSMMEKFILQSISNEVSRTGNEEVSFINMMHKLKNICVLENAEMPSPAICQKLCQNLSAYRLLITQHGSTDINMTLLLNISVDDVHFALR